MTGYTVHTGSTVKFSSGWDNIFGGASGKETARTTKRSKKVAAKTPTVAKKRAKAQRARQSR
jgi:hypothetical protein